MSSVHNAYSQVAPFKRYIATASTKLYSSNGTVITGDLAAGKVLMDMGKYSVATSPAAGATAGATLRKVQVLPINSHQAIYSVPTYIYIGDAVPAAQHVATLN